MNVFASGTVAGRGRVRYSCYCERGTFGVIDHCFSTLLSVTPNWGRFKDFLIKGSLAMTVRREFD